MNFYRGKATIDDQCFIISEDNAFYNFLNTDMYAPISDSVHPDDLENFKNSVNELLKKQPGDTNIVSARLRRHDGVYRWMLIGETFEAFKNDNRKVLSLLITDIEENEIHNGNLKKQNNEFAAYLNLLSGIMLEYKFETGIIKLFIMDIERRRTIFEGTLEQFRQTWIKENVKPSCIENFENMCDDISRGRSVSGDIKLKDMFSKEKYQQYAVKCRVIEDKGRIESVLGCLVPSSRNRDVNAGPSVDYTKDTGIDVLNKKAITDYAKRAIQMVRDNEKVYIAIIDLDNFKIINDTLGHMFGDEVLAASAEIIKEAVGEQGMVGRIGGDEILIVVDQIAEYTEIRNLLREIRTNIEWLYKGKRDDVNLTCSIGAAAYPSHGDSYEKVFKLADAMLYRAKEKGKNRYVIYRPEIHGTNIQVEESAKILEDTNKDKIGMLSRLLEQYLVKRNMTNEMFMSEIGYVFGLDEIQVIGYDDRMTIEWTPETFKADEKTIAYVQLSDEFLKLFNEDNFFAMNGIFNLGNADDKLVDLLKEKRIESALFYKLMKGDDYEGYIMFAKKNGRSSWSENEMLALSVIGKVFALANMDEIQ